MLKIFLFLILLPMVFCFPVPLILEEHSFRQFDSMPFFPITSHSLFLSNHVFKLGISNKTYATERNRMLVYAADSISFEDVQFNFRLRMDQKGMDVADMHWIDSSHSWAYDLDRMVMDLKVNRVLRIKIGKDRFNWGPLRLGGLMLSDYNPGLKMLGQEYTLGDFKLTGLISQLNNVFRTDVLPPNMVITKKRFYSASRLEYQRSRFGLGLSQSILYSGENQEFELQYLVPFYPFYYGMNTTAHAPGYSDNNMGALDYWIIFRQGIKIYGEILIDEFQIETDAYSQSVQNNYALMQGFICRLPYGFEISGEGGRISSFVYNHYGGPSVRYLTGQAFLGSPLGPDQNFLWLQGMFHGNEFWRLSMDFWHRQSGERDIRYDIQTVVNTRHDPVPYGIVEKETAIWLTNSVIKSYLKVKLDAGLLLYQNQDHRLGRNNTQPFVNLSFNSGIVFSKDGK